MARRFCSAGSMKATAAATIAPTTTRPTIERSRARGRAEAGGASLAARGAGRGRARRSVGAGAPAGAAAGFAEEEAGAGAAAPAPAATVRLGSLRLGSVRLGSADARGFGVPAAARGAAGAGAEAATVASESPRSASAETQSGVPSFQMSASLGIRPSCRHACSVARSTGPYSVPSGRWSVYWGSAMRAPSVDPEHVVAEDLHPRARGDDPLLLEARGIDGARRLELLLELLDLRLERRNPRLRVVLHPVLAEDTFRLCNAQWVSLERLGDLDHE